MSRTIFTTNLSTSIATISQRMIAEDEMIPVVLITRPCWVLLRVGMSWTGLARCSFRAYQPLVKQIGQKIQTENDHYQFTVEPSMLEKSGVLANGGSWSKCWWRLFARWCNTVGVAWLSNSWSSIFLQAVQVDDGIRIEPITCSAN